jgi:hypothetical protein
MRDIVLKYPARPPTPVERALVVEWLAAAGDIALAYVSTRDHDDPALKDRIVIITDTAKGPSHLVHAPLGRNIWMVFSTGRRTKVQRFKSLKAALNSIRPVLSEAEATGEAFGISLH